MSKLDKAAVLFQLAGTLALWMMERIGEGKEGRAERRHLRKLRQAERKDEERPADARPGFARKGDV